MKYIYCKTPQEKKVAIKFLEKLCRDCAPESLHELAKIYPYVCIREGVVDAAHKNSVSAENVYEFEELHKYILDHFAPHTIEIDGKTVELSEESYRQLKKQLCG